MTILDMLQQSLYLTLLGMGIVFSFLVILIICMIVAHKVMHAMKLDKEPEETVVSVSASANAGQDTAVVAAIATAIHEKQG